MRCSFSVPGKPQPKQRVRVTRRGGAFTPPATRNYERACAIMGMNARPKGWPTDVKYVVELDLYFPDRRRRDGDNVMKSVLDGLNNVLWDDDSQVVTCRFNKLLDRENPRTDVLVSVFTGWPEVEP